MDKSSLLEMLRISALKDTAWVQWAAQREAPRRKIEQALAADRARVGDAEGALTDFKKKIGADGETILALHRDANGLLLEAEGYPTRPAS
jgi:predicted transposase YdaD